MTYDKDARIAELKAMPREELESLAVRLGIRVIKGFYSPFQLARRIEEREFSDLRTAQKLPRIKDIF